MEPSRFQTHAAFTLIKNSPVLQRPGQHVDKGTLHKRMEASEDDDHLLKLRLMERAKRQIQLLTGLYPKAGGKARQWKIN